MIYKNFHQVTKMDKVDFLKEKTGHIGLLMQGKPNAINIYIEGKDDYNFYYQFLKHLGPNLISCSFKKNVIKVAKLYNKIGVYNSVFFTDKDFDNNETINNLYVTDYYNFESHIFSKENIANYLTSKHSIKDEDIKNLTIFLKSIPILNIFHTEYERIILHNGSSENKLIEGKLTTIDIDKDYNFDSSKLFQRNTVPTIETNILDSIEMYNGKYIANLFFGILNSPWFKTKFKPGMCIKNKTLLISDMIINSNIPEYLKRAISDIRDL